MGKILIVDDSRDMLSLQKMILELEGHKVLTAPSAGDALKFIDSGEHLDLILLDVRMPEWDGPSFLNWLDDHRPQLADIPVVFLTALESPPPSSRIAGFISKMAEADEFTRQVKNYLPPFPTLP